MTSRSRVPTQLTGQQRADLAELDDDMIDEVVGRITEREIRSRLRSILDAAGYVYQEDRTEVPSQARTADEPDTGFRTLLDSRGYDAEDVDQFLDRVEESLAFYIEDNRRLRAELVELSDTRSREDQDPQLVQENSDLRAQIERLRREKVVADESARAVAGELDEMRRGSTEYDNDQQPLRVLMMAQRTADSHAEDTQREAERLISAARAKAQEIIRDAVREADAIERTARQQHSQEMSDLRTKAAALQRDVDQLRDFAREYRKRLEASLSDSLRTLVGEDEEEEATEAATSAEHAEPAETTPEFSS